MAASNRPVLIMIAGFGDTSAMFAPLSKTVLAQQVTLAPLDLPGFGVPRLAGETTLQALAHVVAQHASDRGATAILAHSVASIIACLASRLDGSPITSVLSLEGNLTPQDAYFSGSAADYDNPRRFRAAFLDRLARLGAENAILRGYRDRVTQADAQALWQLGCDARRFSETDDPGAALMAAPRPLYLYNPDNCPRATLDWLAHTPLPRHILPDASHWASQDQPGALSHAILRHLQRG